MGKECVLLLLASRIGSSMFGVVVNLLNVSSPSLHQCLRWLMVMGNGRRR